MPAAQNLFWLAIGRNRGQIVSELYDALRAKAGA